MIFLQLFIVFIQIGIFGFGGGYSMISLIQGQVVTQYHWMTMQEFTDVVAISQMTPGPIGINTATYCGYTAVHNAGMSGMMAVLGSAMATFALVLPSLVLMILISKMLYKYMNTTAVQSIFIGLRPDRRWSCWERSGPSFPPRRTAPDSPPAPPPRQLLI